MIISGNKGRHFKLALYGAFSNTVLTAGHGIYVAYEVTTFATLIPTVHPGSLVKAFSA